MKSVTVGLLRVDLEVELLPDVRADNLVVLLAVVAEHFLLGDEGNKESATEWTGARGRRGRTQASMLAPDSQFGSASIEITLHKAGRDVSHRSADVGYSLSGRVALREEDFLDRLDRAPPLARRLVRVGVIPGRVQDRDAHLTRSVD